MRINSKRTSSSHPLTMMMMLVKLCGAMSMLPKFHGNALPLSKVIESIGTKTRRLIDPSTDTDISPQDILSQVNISLLIESTPSEMNVQRQVLFENRLARFFQSKFILPSITVSKCYVSVISQDWDSNIFEVDDDRTSLLVKIQMDISLKITDDDTSIPIEEYTINFFDSRGENLARDLTKLNDMFFKNVRSVSTPSASITSYYVENNEEEEEVPITNSSSMAGWIIALGSVSAVFRRLTEDEKDNVSVDEDTSDASIKTEAPTHKYIIEELSKNSEPSNCHTGKELILQKYVLDTIPEMESETSSISDAIHDMLIPICKMYSDVEC